MGLFRAVIQPLKSAFGGVVLTQVKSGLMTQHHKCILDHGLSCGEVALQIIGFICCYIIVLVLNIKTTK